MAEVPAGGKRDTTTITGTLDAPQRNHAEHGRPLLGRSSRAPGRQGISLPRRPKGSRQRPWETWIAEPQPRGFSRRPGNGEALRTVYNTVLSCAQRSASTSCATGQKASSAPSRTSWTEVACSQMWQHLAAPGAFGLVDGLGRSG
jgi:hypothetical protein